MIRFKEFLNEVFDKVLPYEEYLHRNTTGGRKFYRFLIPNSKDEYIVTEISQGQDFSTDAVYFDISFFLTDARDSLRVYDMSNRNSYDSFAIMATVVKIVREYNKKYPLPKGGEFRFSAYSSERGKLAVYTRLAKRIAQEINGRVSVDGFDGMLTYITIHK